MTKIELISLDTLKDVSEKYCSLYSCSRSKWHLNLAYSQQSGFEVSEKAPKITRNSEISFLEDDRNRIKRDRNRADK